LCNIYRDEVLYWQQRARLQWLHKGDANTKFFHTIASSKKRSNLISLLHIDGVECRDSSIITNHVFSYYKQLLGTKGSTWLAFSDEIWDEHEKVLVSENSALIAPFTEEKLKLLFFQ
jgi:hypothetical protein